MTTLKETLNFSFYLPNDVRKDGSAPARTFDVSDSGNRLHTPLYPEAPDLGYVSFIVDVENLGEGVIYAEGYDGKKDRILTAAVFTNEDIQLITEKAYASDGGFQQITYGQDNTAKGFLSLNRQMYRAMRSLAVMFIERTVASIDFARLLRVYPELSLHNVRNEPWDAVPAIRATGSLGGYPFHFHFGWGEAALGIYQRENSRKDHFYPLYQIREALSETKEPTYDAVEAQFVSLVESLRHAPVRWVFSIQSEGRGEGDLCVYASSLDEAVASIEEVLAQMSNADKVYTLTEGSIDRADLKNSDLRLDGFR